MPRHALSRINSRGEEEGCCCRDWASGCTTDASMPKLGVTGRIVEGRAGKSREVYCCRKRTSGGSTREGAMHMLEVLGHTMEDDVCKGEVEGFLYCRNRASGGTTMGDSMHKREENSVRVTNLSEDTQEDDLRVRPAFRFRVQLAWHQLHGRHAS